MYQKTTFLSELESDKPLSVGTLAYVGQRAKNSYYDYIITKFLASGLTQAQLAKRIGKGPDRVNRVLSSPGNWTIETVAELLAGISAEELVPSSAKFLGRPVTNHSQADDLDVDGCVLDMSDSKGGVRGSSKSFNLELA